MRRLPDLDSEAIRVLRGNILKLLCTRHNLQAPRMDDTALTAALQGLGYGDLLTPDVVTMLQDLRDRGYVRYEERRDFRTRRLSLSKVELTAMGRDVVEGSVAEPPAVVL